MQRMGLILNKGVGRFGSFGSEFDQKTNGFFFQTLLLGKISKGDGLNVNSRLGRIIHYKLVYTNLSLF